MTKEILKEYGRDALAALLGRKKYAIDCTIKHAGETENWKDVEMYLSDINALTVEEEIRKCATYYISSVYSVSYVAVPLFTLFKSVEVLSTKKEFIKQ